LPRFSLSSLRFAHATAALRWCTTYQFSHQFSCCWFSFRDTRLCGFTFAMVWFSFTAPFFTVCRLQSLRRAPHSSAMFFSVRYDAFSPRSLAAARFLRISWTCTRTYSPLTAPVRLRRILRARLRFTTHLPAPLDTHTHCVLLVASKHTAVLLHIFPWVLVYLSPVLHARGTHAAHCAAVCSRAWTLHWTHIPAGFAVTVCTLGRCLLRRRYVPVSSAHGPYCHYAYTTGSRCKFACLHLHFTVYHTQVTPFTLATWIILRFRYILYYFTPAGFHALCASHTVLGSLHVHAHAQDGSDTCTSLPFVHQFATGLDCGSPAHDASFPTFFTHHFRSPTDTAVYATTYHTGFAHAISPHHTPALTTLHAFAPFLRAAFCGTTPCSRRLPPPPLLPSLLVRFLLPPLRTHLRLALLTPGRYTPTVLAAAQRLHAGTAVAAVAHTHNAISFSGLHFCVCVCFGCGLPFFWIAYTLVTNAPHSSLLRIHTTWFDGSLFFSSTGLHMHCHTAHQFFHVPFYISLHAFLLPLFWFFPFYTHLVCLATGSRHICLKFYLRPHFTRVAVLPLRVTPRLDAYTFHHTRFTARTLLHLPHPLCVPFRSRFWFCMRFRFRAYGCTTAFELCTPHLRTPGFAFAPSLVPHHARCVYIAITRWRTRRTYLTHPRAPVGLHFTCAHGLPPAMHAAFCAPATVRYLFDSHYCTLCQTPVHRLLGFPCTCTGLVSLRLTCYRAVSHTTVPPHIPHAIPASPTGFTFTCSLVRRFGHLLPFAPALLSSPSGAVSGFVRTAFSATAYATFAVGYVLWFWVPSRLVHTCVCSPSSLLDSGYRPHACGLPCPFTFLHRIPGFFLILRTTAHVVSS